MSGKFVSFITSCTVDCKKNENCQNKIDIFLRLFHSVKPSNELELWSKFNDIFKNYLIGIVK
jgi:hypothetical protein